MESPTSLPRRERLRGKERISALFTQGQVGKSRLILARLLPNDLPHCRGAVAVAKAAGGAVTRGRIRRRLRAAFRLCKAHLPTGVDIVLLARRGVETAAFEALLEDLQKAVARAQSAPAEPYVAPQKGASRRRGKGKPPKQSGRSPA